LGLDCLVELVESVIFQRGNPQWLSILLFRDLTLPLTGGGTPYRSVGCSGFQLSLRFVCKSGRAHFPVSSVI